MKSELVQSLVENKAFINSVVALGCFLVIARFLSFIKMQWREGLNPHLVPCGQCGRRLSPRACFCPGCGEMSEASRDLRSETSLAARPVLLGSGPLSTPSRSRQR